MYSLEKNKNTFSTKISLRKKKKQLSHSRKESFQNLKKINFSKRKSSILLMKSSNMAKSNKKKKEIENITPAQLDNIITNSIKNSDIGKILYLMKIIDIIMAILVSANIFFSLLENELFNLKTKNFLKEYFKDKNNKEITRDVYKKCELRKITYEENILRYINMIIVILLIILNYIHYNLNLKMKIKKGLITLEDNFFSTGEWKYFFIENIILIIFDPPHLNFFFTGTMEENIFAFPLGGLICIITIFKSYIIIRLYSYFSKFKTETANYICNDSNVNFNIHFALKCELKKHPFLMLIILLISTVSILGYSLRNFEYFSVPKGFLYGTFSGEGNDQDHLKDLINSIWITIVTMTTVGYGDFYPSENYGRLICILSYLIGCILISLTVVSLAIVSEFSENEKKAYSIIKKLNAENNVILKAAEVISSLCLLRMKIMEKNNKLSERFVYIMKLKQSINTFKNDFKFASSMTLPIDQTFNIIFKGINNNYDNICNNISQLKNINQLTFRIHLSQKNTLKKINKIIKRQQKLGNYLVEFNNEIFKRSIATFTFSPSNVHFQKSECKN